MNYLHLKSWYYQGGEIEAHDAFEKLHEGIKKDIKFPFDCHYQVGLVHCMAQHHWCVGVLVMLETEGDDSMEQSRKLNKWYKECGADFDGTESDCGRVTDPSVEKTLQSRYPNGQYKVIEAFGTLQDQGNKKINGTKKSPIDYKNPWLAGFLNVIIPGLGHIYLKNWGRGIATFVTTLALLFMRYFLSVLVASGGSDPTTCANVFLIVLFGFLFFEGYKKAEKRNKLSTSP